MRHCRNKHLLGQFQFYSQNKINTIIIAQPKHIDILKNCIFPHMKHIIQKFINKCPLCQKDKYERHPYKPLLKGPISESKAFESILLDLYTIKRYHFPTVLDVLSRYAQAYHVPDKNALTISGKLKHYAAHHKLPGCISADNGSESNNILIGEFCQKNDIESSASSFCLPPNKQGTARETTQHIMRKNNSCSRKRLHRVNTKPYEKC